MIEPNLNEIIVQPVIDTDTALALTSPLFSIESIYTTEARIQSVATTTGNEHTVQKLSNESFIATKISEGELALVTSTATNGKQVLNVAPFAKIILR